MGWALAQVVGKDGSRAITPSCSDVVSGDDSAGDW
eukprot:CAMPEP_0170821676 /NCGR_PEP_ID=MMETSP0733-20121128/43222_1 /TAXON_ID=186038 /ORGANISM="Fragilariopsis kerguelensis, Strain L26-C5" /LENGTH=34 /DNA_ID= /DNA_START= /DNA_END= /DNA_ORIENTATION=